MTGTWRGITGAMLAASLLLGPAALAKGEVSPQAMAHAIAPRKAGTTVLRARLANGLRVVIVRDPLSPVVTTEINYLVGSNEAPRGFPGTAHALEHMMFRGSPGLSADQLADLTAEMGGRFDADTRQTVTQYFFTVPSDDLDAALHVEAIRMRRVLATQALWSQERGAIEQEVAQDLSNPTYVFYTQLLAAMFRGTPYAHDALGTRPSFDRTTGAMLKHFHDTWYAPNNAILVIAGDVQPAHALNEVRKLFGTIPARTLPPRPTIALRPVHPETLHVATDLPYGVALVAFRLPGTDNRENAVAQVLADVLSSQRGALYDLVPQGKVLDAGFELASLPGAGLGYALAVYPEGGDGATVLSDLRAILKRYVRDGVPADLVEAAKRREVTDLEFERDSIPGLANAWSEAVAVDGKTSPSEEVREIARVTPADVDRLIREDLTGNHAIAALLTPQVSGKPVSSRGFGGAESFTPTRTRAVKLPSWAQKAVARLVVPKSTLNPVVTVLPNGLELIVQPSTASTGVAVYGQVRNDPQVEEPKGQEGVGQVLDSLLPYGTTRLDRVAFQKALDDIGAEVSAGPSFSLRVLSDHFERGLELLADNEIHPGLPAGAFPVVQREVAGAVAGELQSPDYLAGRALREALFPSSDPTLRQATPQTVSGLSLADIRAYHQLAYRPDLTTLVIMGDVTPARALAAVESSFGSWLGAGPAPRTELPAVPRSRPSSTLVPDQSRVQDKVTLAETLPMTRSNPAYYALQLGNHVLGGAFYATRLYRDLRENAGLVYYVGSSFDIGKTRGIYRLDFASDPGKVSKARAIIVRDLDQMARTPVTPVELDRARALLLREIPLSESSVDEIAGGWLSRTRLGLPLDEPIKAAHRYLDLTAPEVRDAFARWVLPQDLAQVTQGPAPR